MGEKGAGEGEQGLDSRSCRQDFFYLRSLLKRAMRNDATVIKTNPPSLSPSLLRTDERSDERGARRRDASRRVAFPASGRRTNLVPSVRADGF